MAKNNAFDSKNKSLACSEPKLQFHSLKSSMPSYSPYTQFLTLRSILGSWKWSQMIAHDPKHRDKQQKQVSSMFRTQVTISLLEVVLGLLQHLHPTTGDYYHPLRDRGLKTWVWKPKSSLYYVQNQSYNFTPWSRPWPPTTSPPFSWPSDRSETPENGSKWFPIPKNMGFDTMVKSLTCSEAELLRIVTLDLLSEMSQLWAMGRTPKEG